MPQALKNLRKQAKTLLKAWKAADPDAIARIRKSHPRQPSEPRLTDCQLVLAREAGYPSWAKLRAANTKLADEFINNACLCYDDPHFDHRSFHDCAAELLREHPELAHASIWAASAAGNAEAVRGFLDVNPDLVNQPGGPHSWAPLICACYARVPGRSTLETAKLLLDRGADANAFTFKHNDPPGSPNARKFTALAGVLGGGSTGFANQPPHPHWRELAQLLLDHGADPADEQALCINPEAALELLLRYHLKPDAMHEGITLLGRELSKAVRKGHTGRVKLLLAHHARTDEPFEGHTPWQHAIEFGHLEIARMLEEAGAPTVPLTDVERFVSLCMAGDAAEVHAMLRHQPDLLVRVPKDVVFRAANTKRKDAISLAMDLGFDPNWYDDCAALHAIVGDADLVRHLIACGASATLRDPWYDGTVVGWAEFFNHREIRDMLLNEAPICLFDALDYDRLDRVPDILARDPEALHRPFAKCLTREPKPEDWATPLERAQAAGKDAAVQLLRNLGA